MQYPSLHVPNPHYDWFQEPSEQAPHYKERAAKSPITSSWYVTVLCVSFYLYATLGKGFAYAGYNPVFIGEVILLLGLNVAIKTRRLREMAETPLGILLVIFAVWQLACTLPFVRTYGINTFRDAMLWGYCGFAWIMASAIVRVPNTLQLVVGRYRKYIGSLVTVMLCCALLTEFVPDLPHWPGTQITIPLVKSGDMNVHMGASLAFLLVGFRVRRLWWLLPAFIGISVGGVINRGGLFACLGAIVISLVLYPQIGRLIPAMLAIMFAFALALSIDLRVSIPNTDRQLSVQQLYQNLNSAVGSEAETDAGSLQGTKEWRIRWWNKIIDYTIHGSYFWTGKGYGVNLAIDDEIAGDQTALRSPHNSHLTFLARAGVPGAVLWISVQAAWVISMLLAHWKAKRRAQSSWARLFAWLTAYWAAFMINAFFDVSLEGPVCAIPFWIVFGLGWGASSVFQKTEAPKTVDKRALSGLYKNERIWKQVLPTSHTAFLPQRNQV